MFSMMVRLGQYNGLVDYNGQYDGLVDYNDQCNNLVDYNGQYYCHPCAKIKMSLCAAYTLRHKGSNQGVLKDVNSRVLLRM